MSTITQRKSNPIVDRPKPNQLWLAAAICPLLLTPVWLGLSEYAFGPLRSISGLLLTLLLVSSAYTDLTQRKIFNWVTYTTLAWALVVNVLPSSLEPHIGAIGFSSSLIGAVVCFVVMLIPYSLARGGAGDVKLATAIGALVGVDTGLLIIAFTYIVSAVSILAWTVWTSGPFNLLSALLRRVMAKFMPQYCLPPNQQQLRLLDQPIPLAGFFLVATLLIVFDVPANFRGF